MAPGRIGPAIKLSKSPRGDLVFQYQRDGGFGDLPDPDRPDPLDRLLHQAMEAIENQPAAPPIHDVDRIGCVGPHCPPILTGIFVGLADNLTGRDVITIRLCLEKRNVEVPDQFVDRHLVNRRFELPDFTLIPVKVKPDPVDNFGQLAAMASILSRHRASSIPRRRRYRQPPSVDTALRKCYNMRARFSPPASETTIWPEPDNPLNPMSPEVGRHDRINAPLTAGYRLRSLIQEGHRVAGQIEEAPPNPPYDCQIKRRVGRLEADLGLLIIQLEALENDSLRLPDSERKPGQSGL